MTVTDSTIQERIHCVYELMAHFAKHPGKQTTFMELMDDNFPLFNKADLTVYEYVRDILLALQAD